VPEGAYVEIEKARMVVVSWLKMEKCRVKVDQLRGCRK